MAKPLKPRQRNPLISIIGFSISAVVVIFTVVISVYVYRALTADDRSRQNLEAGIAALPVPAGCRERDREYHKGDIDAVSTYSLHYDCDTTGAAAHDAIVSNLQAQGFAKVDDFSTPTAAAKAAFYNFSYKSQKYKVDYFFQPDTSITLESQSLDVLHRSKVTEINISLWNN